MNDAFVVLLLGAGAIAAIWFWRELKDLSRRLRDFEIARRQLEDRIWKLERSGERSRSIPREASEFAPAEPSVSTQESPTVVPLEDGHPVLRAERSAGAAGLSRDSLDVAPPPPPPPLLATGDETVREPVRVTSEAPPVGRPAIQEPSPPSIAFRPLTAVRPAAASEAGTGFDWERFMGAKLFAWLGGLALFLGVAYFVKYSFDHDLVPAWMRVVIGLFTGLGLVVGGMRLRDKAYAVTAQTLCGTGVVILYAALYAGSARYQLPWLPQGLAFVAMTAVTAGAFFLAVRFPALVIALLGMLGGFLTPLLLSSGKDQPGALFTYIALLDLGLLAVALRRRWDFLAVLGAIGTVVMQLGWTARFYGPDRMGLAWVIFAVFCALFVVGLIVAERWQRGSDWHSAAVGIVAFVTLGFAGWLVTGNQAGHRPGLLFAYVLVADLAVLAVGWFRPKLATLHVAAGVLAMGFLGVWQGRFVDDTLLGWALGLTMGFAALHVAFPLVLRQVRPESRQTRMAQLFPPLALAVLVVPMLRVEAISFAVWPVIFLLGLMALAVAAWLGGILGALVALVFTVILSGLWIGHVPMGGESELGLVLLVVAVGGLMFSIVGGVIARRGLASVLAGGENLGSWGEGPKSWSALVGQGEQMAAVQLPVFGSLMPFLLLAQVAVRLSMPEPSAVFAVALLLVLMQLGLTTWLRLGLLPVAGFVAVAVVQHTWLIDELSRATQPVGLVIWGALFLGVFTAFPFVMAGRLKGMSLPWVAAALAGLPQFHFVYRVIERHWPNDAMGLVPLAFAIPPAIGLAILWKRGEFEDPVGLRRAAWFGGMTLFFLTATLPIQFDRQWLTVGLALEGAALVWLYRRIPHPGLGWVGVGLLAVVFARLMLNPEVFEYTLRGPRPILNWWLYTYGLAVASLFFAATQKGATAEVWGKWRVRSWLVGMGVILLFALLNLEIADFFTPEGEYVRLEFTGRFARDMTYTIAWSLFALVLVGIGIGRRVPAARWAGLGLLAVAVAKLFLHDLARLDQLYRVGALIGVALIAITASVLYQRFFATLVNGKETQDKPGTRV